MTIENTSIKAVIFDNDGTLVDLNIDFGMMRQGVESFLADYGIEPHGLKGLYILEMIDEATRQISEQDPAQGSSFYHKSHELVTHIEVRAAKEGKIFQGVLSMLSLLGGKGVKIGIMGCIVNGPGEMADADYGYVGSGPGKITLYKGQEVVKKGLPFLEAVDELINLIKENGDWVEPEILIQKS